MLKKNWLVMALGVLAVSAQAHQIWLEPTDNGQSAAIRFGEFGDNLREASPGLLDHFVKPTATLVEASGDAKSVDASKTANGFAVPFSAKAGASIVAEDAQYPLSKFKRDGKDVSNWYHPAARLITGFAAQQPRLALDLTPTGKDGELKLSFKGQPLAKTKVGIVTQSGWLKEGYTDEKGLISFDLPWKGQYVAEAKHTVRTPGERNGDKYDAINYVTSLTYVKAAGVEPIPAGPVAAPNPAK